jgi:hypothetical protein
MNSNLPPGVSLGMIPGNRPEDEAWEALQVAIWEGLAAKGLDDAANEISSRNRAADDVFDALIEEAYRLGQEHGSAEALANREIEDAEAASGVATKPTFRILGAIMPNAVEELQAESTPIDGRPGWRRTDDGREWYSEAWL